MSNMSNQLRATDLERGISTQLKELFVGQKEGYSRFGEPGYIIPKNFKKHADSVRKMEVYNDDVWVMGYPRSGTTMTQEMVWLLRNDLDFKIASKTFLFDRFYSIDLFPWIHGFKTICDSEFITDDSFKARLTIPHYKMADMASRRHIKAHLPLSLLPPDLLEKAKVIYVARDPRDVAVSYYHQNRLFKFHGYIGDFKKYWDLFMNDFVAWTPYFSHVKEAWAQRHHPNMLFIFYEELTKRTFDTIQRVADFLEKSYSKTEIQKLCDHLDFNTFKQNTSVHPIWMRNSQLVNTEAEMFIRKGKTNGWQDYFDEKMTQQAEKWIMKNLEMCDLRYPHF